MAKILTGIQASGIPHLGNILGAIIPSIKLSEDNKNDCIFFIADLHTLTSNKNPEKRLSYIHQLTATWLAFGLDIDRCLFFRQSKVPEVCELMWYLNCFTPYPMLANAHSFKDKANNLSDVNAGLFTYPVLMAADILLYDAEIVPVGKDQIQHLEITRDIAKSFNNKFGEVFVLPKTKIDEKLMTIPGLDGRKMSKSYNNTVNIFLDEKKLKKQIMSIKTDSIPLENPKNPETCNVFNIFKTLADKVQIENMKSNYLAGNYGYGNAKAELFNLILSKFKKERELFNNFINDINLVENKLVESEKKIKNLAKKKLEKIRKVLKFDQ